MNSQVFSYISKNKIKNKIKNKKQKRIPSNNPQAVPYTPKEVDELNNEYETPCKNCICLPVCITKYKNNIKECDFINNGYLELTISCEILSNRSVNYIKDTMDLEWWNDNHGK